MKTTKAYEIELERHNVTPAQFLAYLRSQQKKHPEMANDFNLNYFRGENWSSCYTLALPSERPCESEIVTDKPYSKQTYIRGFNGACYNEIIEFQFEDETTGYGYYYTVQIDVSPEDDEANTAENVARIAATREANARRDERKADRLEAAANDGETSGAAGWWIESQRTEAARLRREAAETREAIRKSMSGSEDEETSEETEASADTATETETSTTEAKTVTVTNSGTVSSSFEGDHLARDG